jgi:penicillin-insensitive murein endopeptidase
MNRILSPLFIVTLLLPAAAFGQDSTCYGKVNKGYLVHGVQLPPRGNNYYPYSVTGVNLGRTYLHSEARNVVLAAYKALEHSAPTKVFVYGETGWESGGRIRPHRTHQNGLSMDFMVPVINSAGKSVPLPGSVSNKFGYGLEFDSQGRLGELSIDFDAMAEHLYQIVSAAQQAKVGIGLVIFDPVLMPILFKTRRGPYLQRTLPFMKGHAWIRHDEHYHIDFVTQCSPLDDIRS